MFVDELQRITDDHVSENNATLKTPAVWRRFIDELFHDIIEPDWTAKNKILVWDLDYLKSIAVYFATQDDAVLGTLHSNDYLFYFIHHFTFHFSFFFFFFFILSIVKFGSIELF